MKRIAAGTLWFLAIWYAGALMSALFGVSDLLGPILGVSVGLLVAIDPRRVIWRRQQAEVEGTARA